VPTEDKKRYRLSNRESPRAAGDIRSNPLFGQFLVKLGNSVPGSFAPRIPGVSRDWGTGDSQLFAVKAQPSSEVALTAGPANLSTLPIKEHDFLS